MCGIVGYLGVFKHGLLKEALSAIAHRGPDDQGIFENYSHGVGLAHARLSILDLSQFGHQPMLSDDGSVSLIFNGEIYNFKELRSQLEAQGVRFQGNSDTEVLLRLYLSKGEEMLPCLNGIFSFALWDDRKQSLFIARDAMGVKPLYYCASRSRFAFASEIKALLYLVPEERALDIVSIHRYLSFMWCPGDGTPLKGIRKVSPGEAMWVKGGKIERKWIWYKLPIFRGVIAELNKRDAIAGTEHYLKQAVQRQMVADVPVGAFLSGGLDSSAIVAFAREKNPNIHCFTIDSGVQESGVVNDLPYAHKVARHLGVRLEVVKSDHNRIADDIEHMVAQLDEPLSDPAALNTLYISQVARQQGIKVLLSGVGGDDLFTGYRRHRAIQSEFLWKWLPNDLKLFIEQKTANLNQKSTLSRRLGKFFSGATLDGSAGIVNYFFWGRESQLLSLYTHEARCALGGDQASKPMIDFLEPLPADITPLDRMLALEQRFFLADHNLNYADKMSMAEGVEVRVPFLDLDLVEFSAKVPLSFKQNGSQGKWVLKKAMEAYLPKEIIYRPKSGFGVPLRHWMRHELRELLRDLLSPSSLRRRGIFDPIAVENLIKANEHGSVDATYTLFSLMVIEIWCRKYIDYFE